MANPDDKGITLTDRRLSTPDERAKWFTEWASKNPTATVKKGREALREEFGATMGTETLASILREAKQQAGIGQPKTHTGLSFDGNHLMAGLVSRFFDDMERLDPAIKTTVHRTADSYKIEIDVPRKKI
jgi:hypothetical protein